jgi:hypothetical protein
MERTISDLAMTDAQPVGDVRSVWPLAIGWFVLVVTGIGIAWLAFQSVADLARPP